MGRISSGRLPPHNAVIKGRFYVRHRHTGLHVAESPHSHVWRDWLLFFTLGGGGGGGGGGQHVFSRAERSPLIKPLRASSRRAQIDDEQASHDGGG